MRFEFPDWQDPRDGLFETGAAEFPTNFFPAGWGVEYPWGRPPIPATPTVPQEAVEAQAAQNGSGGPGSVVSVTSGNGIAFNLIFDAAAMAAPPGFRTAIQQAANILSAVISDKITINLKIDYSGTGGGAAAGPDSGHYEAYSLIRSDLINNATQGDTIFNALPGGSSIQGQSSVAAWNAQLKLFGLLGANDTTTDDGSATFATDINPNLLVGVALHELTHALGRVPYGSAPDIFDLFRFSSPGTRLFTSGNTATAAYFSVDGGYTKLADYGQKSDPSDFLNPGPTFLGSPYSNLTPHDSFNEIYDSSTLQQLTAIDLNQLDALGFHLTTPDTQAPMLVSNQVLSMLVGSTQTITSSLLSANDNVSTAAQLRFTVTTGPADGVLLLNGSPTSSFTQDDINHGLVSYHETVSGVASDTLLFEVTDAAGNATGTSSFQINIGNGPHGIVNGPHVATDAPDFNGDGDTDLLFLNDTNHGVGVWLLNGTQVLDSPQVGTLVAGFDLAHTGDFNGDGKTDLLMLNDTTHDVAVWLMNGAQVASSTTVGTINAAGGWQFADVGDFNGDGKSDLLFVNSATQGVAVWQMDGAQVTANPQIGIMASGFHFASTGDFNGDGKTDLLMINDTTHDVSIWQMNGTQVTSTTTVGTINAAGGWHFAGVGDFNGDGKSDLFFLNDTTHGAAVWLMNGNQVTANPQIGTINAAGGWHFADIGDFNGDGKSDLLFLNDTTHGVAVWQMNGTQVTANPQIGIAAAGDSYVGLQDINGDHKSDILFENATTNVLTAWEMNGTQVTLNQEIGTINAAAGWHLAT
jgi:hypothetical protein